MGLVDELQRLDDLHRSGVLDDDEFERAKEALLAGQSGTAPPIPPPAPDHASSGLLDDLFDGSGDQSLGRAANRYVSYQVVFGIIGLIVFLILLFAFFLPMFNKARSFEDRFPEIPVLKNSVAPTPHPSDPYVLQSGGRQGGQPDR